MECVRGFWVPIAGWDGSVMRPVSRAWGARWILRVAAGGWMVIAERLINVKTRKLNTNPERRRCKSSADLFLLFTRALTLLSEPSPCWWPETEAWWPPPEPQLWARPPWMWWLSDVTVTQIRQTQCTGQWSRTIIHIIRGVTGPPWRCSMSYHSDLTFHWLLQSAHTGDSLQIFLLNKYVNKLLP